jgi:hypothetical protein
MTDAVENIWKKSDLDLITVLPRHFPSGTEQRTNVFFRLDVNSAGIRRGHLPNKILPDYDSDIKLSTSEMYVNRVFILQCCIVMICPKVN